MRTLTSTGTRRAAILLIGASLGAIAAGVYLPGLPGGFAFDDYHTIVNNQALALPRFDAGSMLDAALTSATGPFKRPLAMLSFAASRSVSGLDPAAFKLANIAIHALNTLLLFALLRRITPSLAAPGAPAVAIAAISTALWAVHPLNLTAVLYVVQRMTSLSSSFMLLALLAYAEARCRELDGRPAAWFAWALVPVAGMLAVLVKETALLLPVYLLVLEAAVFRFRRRPRWRRYAQVAVAILAAGGVAALLFKHPAIFGGYRYRDFTPGERLLTEARVLMMYLRLVVVPDLSVFGLFHDDFALSRNLWSPWTTLPAVLACGAMAALACWRRLPALAFACAWFLGGHLLESSIFPLELAHEHRNYLPAVGILLALVIYGEAALSRGALARLRAPLAAALVLGLALVTIVRAQTWADPAAQAEYDALHHPRSARSQYEVARVRLERAASGHDPALRTAGLQAMRRAAELSPSSPMPLSALLNSLPAAGRADGADEWLVRVRNLQAGARSTVLHDVVYCQAYGRCPPQPALVFALAEIALEHSDPSSADHRRAIEWLAIYYLRVLDDAAAGVDLLRGIVVEAPGDLGLATRLAEALAAAGQTGEARQQGVVIARRLPWHAAWSQRSLWQRVQRLQAG